MLAIWLLEWRAARRHHRMPPGLHAAVFAPSMPRLRPCRLRRGAWQREVPMTWSYRMMLAHNLQHGWKLCSICQLHGLSRHWWGPGGAYWSR